MILVIGSIRTSRQSFRELVGNGSRSLEVLFDFMINFLISASVAKVKVFIKKCMSNEGSTFRSSLSSGNFERIIVILSTKKFENFPKEIFFLTHFGLGNYSSERTKH